MLKAVRSETDGIGACVVFECSGVAASFKASANYARKGGQVILAGFCEDEVPISPLDWIMREIEVKAILGYYDGVRRAQKEPERPASKAEPINHESQTDFGL